MTGGRLYVCVEDCRGKESDRSVPVCLSRRLLRNVCGGACIGEIVSVYERLSGIVCRRDCLSVEEVVEERRETDGCMGGC